MYDLNDRERTIQTLQHFEALLTSRRIAFADPLAGTRTRHLLGQAADMSGPELLAALGIRSIIGDARALKLPSASLDLICSNNTLEHIPGRHREHAHGVSSAPAPTRGDEPLHRHVADHYALFDRKITRYNFLRYPEPAWRLLNNELHYQNRLRLADFRALHEQRGFDPRRGEPPRAARGVAIRAARGPLRRLRRGRAGGLRFLDGLAPTRWRGARSHEVKPERGRRLDLACSLADLLGTAHAARRGATGRVRGRALGSVRARRDAGGSNQAGQPLQSPRGKVGSTVASSSRGAAGLVHAGAARAKKCSRTTYDDWARVWTLGLPTARAFAGINA